MAAALAGAGGPARSTVGLIQAQRAEIEACLGRSDLEFQRERINHLQGGDDGALEAGAELAQTTLRKLRRIEPGPGEVVRLSVAGTLGRLIVDRSCNGDCNPTAVLEALTALADGETTGAVAATVTVVRKLLDLAGDVPEGAEGLPEPFGFLARVERGVDPEDGWPAPATLGRGGCAYWMRLCIARGGTRVSACVAALERDDAPTAVEAWLAAGRQVARAVPYATFARGAVGAGRVNLEVAQIALLALDVDAAKEALGEQSFAERSTHREALRWDLLQAERLLALGEWGQAEALLQKLCEPGVPCDTAKLADRWAARAFALAALGRPEAAARELKVAASRKKEAWLPGGPSPTARSSWAGARASRRGCDGR